MQILLRKVVFVAVLFISGLARDGRADPVVRLTDSASQRLSPPAAVVQVRAGADIRLWAFRVSPDPVGGSAGELPAGVAGPLGLVGDGLHIADARFALHVSIPSVTSGTVVRINAASIAQNSGLLHQPLVGNASGDTNDWMPKINRVVDDAVVYADLTSWMTFYAGRTKVPFSRFRQLDRGNLAGWLLPEITARVAPDRRWGAGISGDLGALGYSAGGFADRDGFERPRDTTATITVPTYDPSEHGNVAMAAHVEFTPRAPFGVDFAPLARTNPWFDTAVYTIGAGFLARWSEYRTGARIDLSLSAQAKYRGVSGSIETVASITEDERFLGVVADLGVLVTDSFLAFGRIEYDGEQSASTAGGGAAVYWPGTRRQAISLYAFRRAHAAMPVQTGAILQLQAAW